MTSRSWQYILCHWDTRPNHSKLSGPFLDIPTHDLRVESDHRHSILELIALSIKDKDKDKDAFIGPKEFASHLMMTQTKDKLFHQLK